MKSYNLKMDLQLFADPSASLQNTTGTMTNEMKTFYEKRLIDQAEPRLVDKALRLLCRRAGHSACHL